MGRLLVIDPRDDVGIALEDIASGEPLSVDGNPLRGLRAAEVVPFGHKVSIRPIRTGEPVRRYGEVIGVATSDIPPGRHVHTHNVASRYKAEGEAATRSSVTFQVPKPHDRKVEPATAVGSGVTFSGYRRRDGTTGIRNLVVVLALQDNSTSVVRRIGATVPEAVAVGSWFGLAQFGPDHILRQRVWLGLATHPNVAGAVLVGLEGASAAPLAEAVAAAGRLVEVVDVQRAGGTVAAAEQGAGLAARMVREAARQTREPLRAELIVGLECGASDNTSGITANPVIGLVADRLVRLGGTVIISEPTEMLGAEHLLAQRCANEEVARQLSEIIARRYGLAKSLGVDLLGVNPGPVNIAAGLSTIEEKAMGAIQKAGSSTICEVVDHGASPSHTGLVVMDAPSPAVENMTALAAGGAHLILFGTGTCNPVGNPFAPTVKITGNPRTAQRMRDHIDLDVSGVIMGTDSLATSAERAFSLTLEVASGKLTRAEILGDLEIAISRLNPSV